MKIIIVGCGKVGKTLVEELSREEDHELTVIDLRADLVQDLTGRFDVKGVEGNCTSIDTLTEAGIEEADILIAVTDSDELNLLTCLMAKKSGNVKTIARVRNPEYGKSLSLFKEDLGLAMIINPERTAANEIARLLRFPSAIQIDTFAKGRIEILKFKLPAGSLLCDLRIADIFNEVGLNVLVCGVERGSEVFIPGGDLVLKEGDLVSIITAIENGTEFFKKIGVKTNRVKNTTIVGGGSTAYYLATQLIKAGVHVKIIEKKLARCEELCRLLPKATIIHGDGSDNQILLEEGIESAESFVSLTNMDEENVLLSLFAKSKMNGKIVTKINKISFDDVINSLDIGTIVYPKEITAEYIVRFVRAKSNSIGSNVETMHHILDGKAEALEFRITENSPVLGKPLEKLNLKNNTLVAFINRKGKLISPRGQDVILAGDTVIVVTTNTGYDDIRDILA